MTDKTTIDTTPLHNSAQHIGELYQQLLPTLLALHEKYPETKYGVRTDIDHYDPFCRVIDLVPVKHSHVMIVADEPDLPFVRSMLQDAGKTIGIFAQSLSLLEHYRNDPIVSQSNAIEVNQLLRDTLLDAYARVDRLHAPKRHGVADIINEGRTAPIAMKAPDGR